MDRDGPKRAGEKLSTPETEQPKHYRSHFAVSSDTLYRRLVNCFITCPGIAPDEAEELISNLLASILVRYRGLSMGFTVFPQPVAEIGTAETLAEFNAKTPLGTRTKQLAEPSKKLNELINMNCNLVTDDEIWSAVNRTASFNGEKIESILWIEDCIQSVAEIAFSDRAINQSILATDPGLVGYFAKHFNGRLTFANNVEGIAGENKPLMSSIIAGLMKKIMSETGWGTHEILDQLLNYGETELNNVIYRLRIGRNGAIGNDHRLEDCFNIVFRRGRLIMVSANKKIEKKKADDIKAHNTDNENFRQVWTILSRKAEAMGIKISFDIGSRFGLNNGNGGVCPVTYADESEGEAYLPQVQLALRTLRIIREYQELHKPSLPVRLKNTLLRRAGNLVKLPLKNTKWKK